MTPLELVAQFHAQMATTMKWVAEGFVAAVFLTFLYISRTAYLRRKW